MTTNENNLDIQAILEELPTDKRILLEKLSKVFDRKTAIDFVSPKPFETKRHLTIEDLLNVDNEQQEKHFQRLRSMEHYQTTTQSLSQTELEATYEAFIRGEIAHKPYSYKELEQFVRNNADINAVDYYINSTHHNATSGPLQAHLLFHSSKLNEQKANLIKSASSNRSLKSFNDSLSVRGYFPEKLLTHSRSSSKEKELDNNQQNYSKQRSMHIDHGEKKYHVTFLKDPNTSVKSSKHKTKNHNVHNKNIESLFKREAILGSNLSTKSNTSNIHRQKFPPLSLSALKEYRPTMSPKSSTIPTTPHIQKQKPKRKTDFIWEQTIVSQKHK
ncbi:unnamed protein product [Adineta steineri]|uniref:Uncharacterized protein n=1 Tax=Adineta steineri TaxID=433720 RepID=A0A818LR89_9BILA|nr:unnamed protein product [Adineta steineri]